MASVKDFTDITGASQEQALFYLDAAKGDLQVALENFFAANNAAGGAADGDDDDDADADAEGTIDEPAPVSRGASSSASSAANLTRGGTGSSGSDGAAKRKAAQGRRPGGGVATLSSVRDAADDDDDDDDKPAEFYTGGEKSGLGVIDPTKRRSGESAASGAGPQDLLEKILKKAAAGGQAAAEDDGEGAGKRSAFRGGGYTLGGEDQDSQRVDDPNEVFRRAMATQPPEVKRTLKLWRDGFSVDDGRLYRFDDPANKEYLEQINNGRAPLDVLNVQYGQHVTVSVEKRSDEDYVAPPKVFKPFEGAGHRLGAEIPPDPHASAQTSAAAAKPARSTSAGGAASPPQADVDESKPTTTLQVRLASGGRLQLRLNTTHTVADVYALVARADGTGRDFVLLTTFPRKEFAKDDTTTIESAHLLKGVLQQKYS